MTCYKEYNTIRVNRCESLTLFAILRRKASFLKSKQVVVWVYKLIDPIQSSDPFQTQVNTVMNKKKKKKKKKTWTQFQVFFFQQKCSDILFLNKEQYVVGRANALLAKSYNIYMYSWRNKKHITWIPPLIGNYVLNIATNQLLKTLLQNYFVIRKLGKKTFFFPYKNCIVNLHLQWIDVFCQSFLVMVYISV